MARDELATHFAWPRRPVVIPDFCAAWPAFARWSLIGLRERFGDVQVQVNGAPCRFATVIDEVRGSHAERPGRYLREFYLARELPEVLPELAPIPGNTHNRLCSRLLPIGKRQRKMFGPPELLISGPGTHFPVLHYDVHHLHAFITQLEGEKEFTVFPPEQTPHLYPREDNPQQSRIDRFDPVDVERFPRFSQAQAIRFRVHAGETVFVPSGWWHYTRTLSPSLAITWNSLTRANWRAFCRDYFGVGRDKGPRALAKRVYLQVLGTLLTLRERLA